MIHSKSTWAVRMASMWNNSNTEGAGRTEKCGNEVSKMMIYSIYINKLIQ